MSLIKYSSYIAALWIIIHSSSTALAQYSNYHYQHTEALAEKGAASMIQDDQGFIWFTSKDGGVFRYDGRNITPWLPKSFKPWELILDKEGNIWLDYFTNANPQTNGYINPKEDRFIIVPDSGRIFSGANGEVWLHSDQGISFFDFKNHAFTLSRSFPDSIINSDNKLIDLIQDSYHKLWVSTSRNGIYRFSLTGDTSDHYPNHQGGFFWEDRQKNLWFHEPGTENPIYQYERKGRKFTINKSIPSSELSLLSSVAESKDGKIWLTNWFQNSLHIFDPQTGNFTTEKKIKAKRVFNDQEGNIWAFSDENAYQVSFTSPQEEPEIVMTDFRINNQSVPTKNPNDTTTSASPLYRSISYISTIELAHDQNALMFEFAVLNFSHPEKNRFKYRLEPLEKEWVESDQPLAGYKDLAPGLYTFRATGANHQGIWNEKGVSVRVYIKPNWWQNWWSDLNYGAYILYEMLMESIEE